MRITRRFPCLALVLFALLAGCAPEQPLFTPKEFDRFLTDARIVNRTVAGLAETFKTPGAEAKTDMHAIEEKEIQRMGWDPARYRYIYGRCADYAAYEHAREEAERIGKAFAKAAEHGSKKQVDDTLPKGLAKRARLLGEMVEQNMPISERVLIHDRLGDVMHIVRLADIMDRM